MRKPYRSAVSTNQVPFTPYTLAVKAAVAGAKSEAQAALYGKESSYLGKTTFNLNPGEVADSASEALQGCGGARPGPPSITYLACIASAGLKYISLGLYT